MRKKIYSRCFALLSVVLILCACAVPAFATGEDFGVDRYATIPFEYLVVSGYGGPIDYFGDHSRVGTSLTTSITGFDGYDFPVTCDVRCVTNSFSATYHLPFVPATGATSTTSIAFYLNNTFTMPFLNGTVFMLADTNYTITKINIKGNYETPMNILDKPVFAHNPIDKGFDVSFEANEPIDIAQFIRDALSISREFDPNGMLFKDLMVQFFVRRNDASDTTILFNCTNTTYGMNTRPLDMMQWIRDKLSVFDLSPPPPVVDTTDFNVGLFLGDTVSSVMNTSIWGEFTLGHIFGIALTLGVLFFALKLLV